MTVVIININININNFDLIIITKKDRCLFGTNHIPRQIYLISDLHLCK